MLTVMGKTHEWLHWNQLFCCIVRVHVKMRDILLINMIKDQVYFIIYEIQQ